jgi:hypothetical protein
LVLRQWCNKGLFYDKTKLANEAVLIITFALKRNNVIPVVRIANTSSILPEPWPVQIMVLLSEAKKKILINLM